MRKVVLEVIAVLKLFFLIESVIFFSAGGSDAPVEKAVSLILTFIIIKWFCRHLQILLE